MLYNCAMRERTSWYLGEKKTLIEIDFQLLDAEKEQMFLSVNLVQWYNVGNYFRKKTTTSQVNTGLSDLCLFQYHSF